MVEITEDFDALRNNLRHLKTSLESERVKAQEKLFTDFTQNIMNVFDKYDPPNKKYKDRLETIKKAKSAQADILERL